MPVMNSETRVTLPPPFFRPDAGDLCVWVALQAGPPIGVILSRQVLQYRLQAQPDGSDAVARYEAHRNEIDAAVLRRVAAGSIEPVILREHDLPAPPRR
jgi:hypothetical protein